MGACSFCVIGYGTSAEAAFSALRKSAKERHADRGYTGTIAEKDRLIRLTPSHPITEDFYPYQSDDPCWEVVQDKWGPAGCFDLGDGKYMFIGFAPE
jgi:hypothetical protein